MQKMPSEWTPHKGIPFKKNGGIKQREKSNDTNNFVRPTMRGRPNRTQ